MKGVFAHLISFNNVFISPHSYDVLIAGRLIDEALSIVTGPEQLDGLYRTARSCSLFMSGGAMLIHNLRNK